MKNSRRIRPLTSLRRRLLRQPARRRKQSQRQQHHHQTDMPERSQHKSPRAQVRIKEKPLAVEQSVVKQTPRPVHEHGVTRSERRGRQDAELGLVSHAQILGDERAGVVELLPGHRT